MFRLQQQQHPQYIISSKLPDHPNETELSNKFKEMKSIRRDRKTYGRSNITINMASVSSNTENHNNKSVMTSSASMSDIIDVINNDNNNFDTINDNEIEKDNENQSIIDIERSSQTQSQKQPQVQIRTQLQTQKQKQSSTENIMFTPYLSTSIVNMQSQEIIVTSTEPTENPQQVRRGSLTRRKRLKISHDPNVSYIIELN